MTDEELEMMIDDFKADMILIDKAIEAKEEGNFSKAIRLVHQYDEVVEDEIKYWGIVYEWAVEDGLVVDTNNLF